MARKGENIFKRKDGRWEARYEKGRDLNGRIIYGYCYAATYRDARQKVNSLKVAVANGQATEKSSIKTYFSNYCDEWLREKSTYVKQSTFVKYNSVVENHIIPELGNYRLSAINSETCCRLKDKLVSSGHSPKMVRDVITVLRSILKYVHKTNPSFQCEVDIPLPKEQRKEMRVLSLEEEIKFISFLSDEMDNCKLGILIAIMTGMRIGEICALKWGAVSFADESVKVVSTMQRLKCFGGNTSAKTAVVVGMPKSQTSSRTIPLTAECVALCKKMRSDNPDAFILTGTTDYMEPRALQYRMSKYTKECGLCGVHFHTLRHTFATRAVEVGFEIKSLSEILGHANTTVTMDRYVHSSMLLKRQNMEKMPALIV